jgi:hypothetical protein
VQWGVSAPAGLQHGPAGVLTVGHVRSLRELSGADDLRRARVRREEVRSAECESWARHPGYCAECTRVTSEESSGGTYTLNGIGTKLYFRRQTCPTCGSCVQTKFFCVFYFPLIPLGSYRVRWATPKRFFSRRVLKNMALPVSVS